MDHEDAQYISMPSWKAEKNALDGNRFDYLRAGERRCVEIEVLTDAESNGRTFALRQEKYAVQRMASAIGLFGDAPSPETVTLRLSPCP